MNNINKECKYIIHKQEGIISSEIRFNNRDDPDLKKFQRLLAEGIRNKRNVELLNCDKIFSHFESIYVLFKRDVFGEAKTAIEDFRKEYTENPAHPGVLDFLFNAKKYRKWKSYIESREFKENYVWLKVRELYACMIEITHDGPFIACESKIHIEDELQSDIEDAAEALSMKLINIKIT